MKIIRLLSLLLTVAALLSSCQPKPKLAYLVPEATGSPGYKARGAEGVFENKAFIASARQVKQNDVSDELLTSLLGKDYIVIALTIENKSGAKLIYKPNYTALMNSVDYLKPLDYTDLYEFGGEAADGLKGRFFDLDVTLPPGTKATGLLIFTPVSKDAKKATLEVREFYVGTSTTAFSLPFQLKATPY